MNATMIEFLRRLREDGLLHHLKGNSGLTIIEQKLIEQISDGMP